MMSFRDEAEKLFAEQLLLGDEEGYERTFQKLTALHKQEVELAKLKARLAENRESENLKHAGPNVWTYDWITEFYEIRHKTLERNIREFEQRPRANGEGEE